MADIGSFLVSLFQPNGLHASFWEKMTASSNTLAMSQLWMCNISRDTVENVNGEIDLILPEAERGWSIKADKQIATKASWWMGGQYCFLVKGMNIPQDGLDVSRAGVEKSGTIKGLIGSQRRELETAKIHFYETNQSFVDLFLRPWAILVGHKSLKYFPLRWDIELVCLQKAPGAPIVRKKFILENACPISVDGEEYNYTADALMNRQVEFAYSKYRVEATVGTDQLYIPHILMVLQILGESKYGRTFNILNNLLVDVLNSAQLTPAIARLTNNPLIAALTQQGGDIRGALEQLAVEGVSGAAATLGDLLPGVLGASEVGTQQRGPLPDFGALFQNFNLLRSLGFGNNTTTANQVAEQAANDAASTVGQSINPGVDLSNLSDEQLQGLREGIQRAREAVERGESSTWGLTDGLNEIIRP
jgi:hypothetical protein